MNSAYPLKRLGDVLSLEYGKPLPASDRVAEPGIPAYGANGILCWSCKAYRTEPSIIVGRKGSAGEVTLTEGPFWPTDVTYFVKHNQAQTDLLYLFHLLRFLRLPQLAKGVKPGINRNDVYGLQAPIPSISEQRRIAAIIEEILGGISRANANTAKKLELAFELQRYLRDSILQSQGSWTNTTLGEVADFKNGLNFSRMSRGESIRVVGVADFKDAHWVDAASLQAVTIDSSLSPAYELHKGDILVVRSNGNKALIGRCLIVGEVPPKTSYSGFTIRVRVNEPGVMPEFLAHLLKSRRLRRLMVAGGAGANISSLNQGTLEALPIAFPSVTEQKEILSRIEAMQADSQSLITNTSAKRAALDELRSSLLQRAFSGQLTQAPAVAA